MIPAALFASNTLQIATQRVGNSWQWYVIRAAGFLAAGLVILLMLSGIGQVTGLTYRFIEPVKAWAIHKAMAIALCAAIVVHIVFLLFDHFVHFSVWQLVIPFQSQYNNHTTFLGIAVGGLAVSFGILALYGIIVLVASSLGWIDSKKQIWRRLHYLSYAVMLLILLHGLYVGTDLRYGTFRAAWLALGGVVLAGIILRLRRAGTLSNTKNTNTDASDDNDNPLKSGKYH